GRGRGEEREWDAEEAEERRPGVDPRRFEVDVPTLEHQVADQQVTREVARPPDPHRHTDDRRDEERPEGEPAGRRMGETIQPVGGGRDRGRQRLSVAPAPAGCQARPPRRPGTIDAVRSHLVAGAVLVALLGLALYLPGLGAEILRHPLEAKYALVAQEM